MIFMIKPYFTKIGYLRGDHAGEPTPENPENRRFPH